MERRNFLNLKNPDHLMLVDIIYHKPKKNNEWTDTLDIIYKDLKEGEKKLLSIVKPKMHFYYTKEQHRNYSHNKAYIELDKVEEVECEYKNIEFAIANCGTQDDKNYANECVKSRNRRQLKNFHKHKNVFGSDYDIENWYKIQWKLNYDNNLPKPITKMYLDIEVDSKEIIGFPTDGNCPINAVSLFDEETKQFFVFVLREKSNPLIEKFEDGIDDFIKELHEEFDDIYGDDIDYKIYMYDKEIELIKDLFKLINHYKRDFLMIWNISFDMTFFIDRINNLGYDPADIICHSDFREKEVYFYKDKRNFKVENKGDYVFASSYTTYLDQMIVYAGLRKGGGELRSNALNFTAKKEIGEEKLNYNEVANIKVFPYVNFNKFIMYNIKDVLLQYGIERKTKDIDNLYQRGYSNATIFKKIFKQTIFLKNRAYLEFMGQNLIIGNNVNLDYNTEYSDVPLDGGEKEEESYSGGLVADPTLNNRMGMLIFKEKSKYVFINVVDMDFSSMYPHIIIAFNIYVSTLIGKLFIYDDKGEPNPKLGEKFMENIQEDNILVTATEWFNLPSIDEVDRLFRDEFGI